MARPIHPIILCGGNGTRLWPVSRASFPKQFSALLGEESLFQATVNRLPPPVFAPPRIVTTAEFRFIVTEQLAALERSPGGILLEPEGRNTGPSLLAAALILARSEPEAILVACPSDHAIGAPEALQAAIRAGLRPARDGRIVTFGIPPSHAETGYGYLELATPLPPCDPDLPPAPQPLLGFVEKPDAATARDMIDTGRYLWNSGLFLARAATLVEAAEVHAPDMLAAVRDALDAARPDLGFLRLEPETWSRVPARSIDYAIMEKADNLTVVPLTGGWSDLGNWETIAREMWTDRRGVTAHGRAIALDCDDTLLRVEGEGQALVGIGLRNIVAVAMDDAVLVADREHGQQVGAAVRLLKEQAIPQAEEFPRTHRPWGWYECLSKGPGFQVKRIAVHPGASLSLQSHAHRAEHWVVVEGTATATIGETVHRLEKNQSVYVPLGARHRLENPGTTMLTMIEVQSGAYLGEDDITRYEDVYARV